MSRKQVVKVRLTTIEKARIRKLAEAAGQKSIASYLRARGLQRLRSGGLTKLISAVVLNANLLSQISKRTANRRSVDQAALHKAMSENRLLVELLRRRFEPKHARDAGRSQNPL